MEASFNKAQNTLIISGEEQVLGEVVAFISNVKSELVVFADSRGPSIAMRVDQYRNLYLQLKKMGVSVKFVTEITEKNLGDCKDLMQYAELRHLDTIKGNFAVSDNGEYVATATLYHTDLPLQQLIYSNVKEMVDQQRYIFDSLWERAIPAEQRIKEIEEHCEREFFDVISDGEKVEQTIMELAKSIKKEALLFLPSPKSLIRAQDMGLLEYMVDAANKGCSVKMICPLTEENFHIADLILKRAPAIQIINGSCSEAGMLIVDESRFLRPNIRDVHAHTFSKAVGFSLYSNSRAAINSFKLFFNLIWNERMVIEELKRADRLQKEFINIAAHEIRTPTQVILGYIELLHLQPDKKDWALEGIERNAARLQRLIEDILDVTRIESSTLKLNKQTFDLVYLIESYLNDMKNQLQNEQKCPLNFFFEYKDRDSHNHLQKLDRIFVYADRERIGQVILNLLNNATKFTKDGHITILIEKRIINDAPYVYVHVKDTGTGIDPEILPRLFTKFATKSQTGTGLGLYISKSIIEAHGGRMWAKNNEDGRGATFEFTLPLDTRE